MVVWGLLGVGGEEVGSLETKGGCGREEEKEGGDRLKRVKVRGIRR